MRDHSMREHRVAEVNRLKACVARYQSIADRPYDRRAASLLQTILQRVATGD
jgi:hypothetical protein